MRTLQAVLPWFEDFVLETEGKKGVLLRWRMAGRGDYLFGPGQLSDGSLRIMALVSLLLLPEGMFVDRLIRNHLILHGVKVERSILAATSMDPSGRRGGFVNWDAIQFDLRQLFASDADPDLRFTTLLDVYAMPSQVLGLAGFSAPVTAGADIEAVERAIETIFGELGSTMTL